MRRIGTHVALLFLCVAASAQAAEVPFGGEQVISAAADAARFVSTAHLVGDGDPDELSASCNDDRIARYENPGGE